MTEKTISGVHVHVSPGSAETLVRRGGITNHQLIAYSLSNISAKNYQTRLLRVEVTVCNISVVFEQSVFTAEITTCLYFRTMTFASFFDKSLLRMRSHTSWAHSSLGFCLYPVCADGYNVVRTLSLTRQCHATASEDTVADTHGSTTSSCDRLTTNERRDLLAAPEFA